MQHLTSQPLKELNPEAPEDYIKENTSVGIF